jgi:hypothetical protein
VNDGVRAIAETRVLVVFLSSATHAATEPRSYGGHGAEPALTVFLPSFRFCCVFCPEF